MAKMLLRFSVGLSKTFRHDKSAEAFQLPRSLLTLLIKHMISNHLSAAAVHSSEIELISDRL